MGKRIIIGLVLTLIIFFVARRLSTNNPEYINLEENGVRVEHSTVFEQVGTGKSVIRVKVTPSDSISVSLIYISLRDSVRKDVKMIRGDSEIWEADLPSLNKGERLKYSFVFFRDGKRVLRVPADGGFYLVKYKGDISTVVLILHIIFMFSAFFFIIETFLGALWILLSGEAIGYTIKMMRIALSFLFIGGWPLGFILNYQRFGPVWEGFPFGWDITDNKTQIIFLFWLITTFLVRGSFFGRGQEGDVIGKKQYAVVVIISFIVTVGLYLVPHSL
ncbi:hypothetical protein J7M07_02500 [bacterium]|nr:hypothetical protein [bacterium]